MNKNFPHLNQDSNIYFPAMTASHNFASLCDNPVLCKDNMSTKRALPWVKEPEREAEHSPTSNTKVKNEWSHTFTPQSHGVYRDKLILHVCVSGSG
jgi:hypothetical protein